MTEQFSVHFDLFKFVNVQVRAVIGLAPLLWMARQRLVKIHVSSNPIDSIGGSPSIAAL